MGSPPESLLTVVERRRKHRVTGAAARTDRRSLETPLSTPTEAASTSRRGEATRRESKETASGNRMCQPRPVALCQGYVRDTCSEVSQQESSRKVHLLGQRIGTVLGL